MKKYFTFLILSVLAVTSNAQVETPSTDEADDIVVVAPSSGPQRRRQSIYTPQNAISDALSEPLTYVGRGIPDPIRDDNGVIITEGASQYCVFKNSKVYVVHQGCRPTPRQEVSVMVMEVFSRSGQSVKFYAEPNSSSYSLNSLGNSFSGSWNISYRRSPMINGDLNLTAFFEYYNSVESNTNLGACTYGRPMAGGDARLVCVKMPEETSFRDAASSAYSSPSTIRFNEFHDAVRFHSRNSN